MSGVIRTVLISCAVASIVCPAAASARSLEDPPSGLHSAAATLADVLTHYDTSEGDRRFHTRIAVWRVSEHGLNGTYVETTSGEDYRATLTLGPLVTSNGRWHGQSWRQDENGLTVFTQDIHQKTAISEKAIDYALDHPKAPGDGVELVGEVSDPTDAYVVRVYPRGGRLVWLFFDAASGLIDREEDVVAERRTVTQYGDYRAIDGEMQAWHRTTSDGHPNNDEEWTLQSLRNDVPVSPSDIAIPPDRRVLVEFPSGEQQVRLPARIIGGRVVVRVMIAGRGLDFMLDSGAGDIALDSGLVPVLHLQTIGRSTQVVAGQFDRSKAIVPEMQVGDLRLHDVVVSTLPFEAQALPDVKIVGLLGFDFFRGAVVRIDYSAGIVDAIEPERFTAPDGVTSMPIALDDGVPLVPATVGDATGAHFILDTGSVFTIVFSGFAADHPDAVADQGGGSLSRREQATVGEGVGGEILLVPTELRSFTFGGQRFEYFQAFVTQSARAFESEDEDGLIGSPTLQHFTVYLDYQHQRIDLVRNG